tara:strand:+ start:43 stop:522 length:480 start_codon:yes stop_codon:yes gene_type:complete
LSDVQGISWGMLDFSFDTLNWIKALHIISAIAWMAGLLYLPRLFVYHAEAHIDSELYKTFIIMERRLLYFIICPAMLSSLTFGLLLLFSFDPIIWSFWWWKIKLISLFLLLLVQILMMYLRGLFILNKNIYSQTFYRYFNEVPTILMIIIVIMAVVEPF